MLRLAFYLLAANLFLTWLPSCQAQPVSSTAIPPPKKTSRGIFGIEFSRDGKTLVTGNFNGTVRLWDMASGRVLQTLDGHSNLVYKGVLSPDEKILASCSLDGNIKLWDLATGRELRTLTGHTEAVKAVAFSPDGKLLASASNDGTLRLWDVLSGLERRSLVHTRSTDVDSSVYAVVFISQGKIIAAGNGDGTISYWEVNSGKELRVLKGHSDLVFCLALSADGRSLASGSYDHTVKLWDVVAGKEIRTFADKKMTEVSEQVRAISLSSDGKWLATSEVGFTSSGNQFQYVYKRVKVWNVKSGEHVFAVDQPGFEINGVAFTRDNNLLAGAGADGVIKLWNVKSGREERSFSLPVAEKKKLTLAVSNVGVSVERERSAPLTNTLR
ncbi:MAG TPA: WD40 repeat domain-containing protein [Pyrinomonadaceae bacterium]|nr:WD40 repeat domain-containing protein [Pyrinomonadaceae bacterium]